MVSDEARTMEVTKKVVDTLIKYRIDEKARVVIPSFIVMLAKFQERPDSNPVDIESEKSMDYYYRLFFEISLVIDQAMKGNDECKKAVAEVYSLMEERKAQLLS